MKKVEVTAEDVNKAFDKWIDYTDPHTIRPSLQDFVIEELGLDEPPPQQITITYKDFNKAWEAAEICNTRESLAKLLGFKENT